MQAIDNSDTELEELKGTVAAVVYATENGYTIAKLEQEDFSVYTIVGIVPQLRKGQRLTVKGVWKNHPKFGVQLEVKDFSLEKPTSTEDIADYLANAGLPGIGEKLAYRIAEKFGENTFSVFDNSQTNRLKTVKGLTDKNIPEILKAWGEQTLLRELVIFLRRFDIPASFAPRIFKVWKGSSIERLKANPYDAVYEIDGIGFKKADEMALKMGIELDSPFRLQAGIFHAIAQGGAKGHCYLNRDDVPLAAKAELCTPLYEPTIEHLNRVLGGMAMGGRNAVIQIDKGKVYTKKMYWYEKGLAQRIRDLAGELSAGIDVEEWLDWYCNEQGLQLADGQRDAVIQASKSGGMVLTGTPGSGKLQPLDEPVLTPNGWVRMGDIKVGDYVISKDGSPTKVLGTYPGKDLEIYRVEFEDGSWTECCIDHLWEVQTPKNRIKNKYSVLSLQQIIQRMEEHKSSVAGKKKTNYYSVEFCQPVQFPKKEFAIHPYLLGFLLGDGYIPERKGATISTWIVDSEEIAARLDQYLPPDVKSRLDLPSPSGPNVRRYQLSSSISLYLSDLGLSGKKSQEKFIPNEYLYSDITDRKFLLSGLLDTDGTVNARNENNKKILFSTTSPYLSDGVIELVRSLGGRASVSKIFRKGCMNYTVAIRLPFNPFILHRKQEKYGDHKGVQKFVKRITDVVYVGKKDGQCIKVAHHSSLYLTRDYTVTHNTTVTRTILALWQSMGLNFITASPTGKAAQRMTESTGVKATTIHRLLGWNGIGFVHNSEEPFECNAIAIDEASMLDLPLAYALFEAIPPDARVLLIGDINQLPSVGPGTVLMDIMDSEEVPVVRLTQVFRQAAESKIISSSLAINKGLVPSLEIGRKGLEPKTDCIWFQNEQIVKVIEYLVSEWLPEQGFSHDDIQILSPMKKSDTGTIALNKLAQEIINPKSLAKREYVRGGGEFRVCFREGDRVIQRKNDYNKGVFNGDIGFIRKIMGELKIIQIGFNDSGKERIVDYDFGDMDEVQHAFAMTIHSSQGSEFPAVILPLTKSHYTMLQRNLIYTGLTRAKKMAVFVGLEEPMEIAVKKVDFQRRNTYLKERIVG